jgi:hypothetical protein
VRRWIGRSARLLLLAGFVACAVLPAAAGEKKTARHWLPRRGASAPEAPEPLPPVDGALPPKARYDEAEAFFEAGVIPKLRIEVAEDQMASLRQNPRAYARAAVREGEALYTDVGIHLKGYYGSFRGVDDKPALTLNFNKNVHEQRFHGLTQIHLNNSVQDPTFMCENLCGSIYRDAGVPAPRVTNARVWLNGRDLGFYVLLEAFDRTFLKRFFANCNGTLYEPPGQADVDQALRQASHDDRRGGGDLKELAAAASVPDAAARRERLGRILDVDRFITGMVLESMTGNWDGYSGNRNNFRIYHDPSTDRLVFLPHGMDYSFNNASLQLILNNSLVSRAVTGTPQDVQRCLDRALELRDTVFQPDALTNRVARIAARIAPAMQEWNADQARAFRDQEAGLRRRIVERVAFIDAQLAPQRRVAKFDPSGAAAPAGWEPKLAEGQASHDRVEKAGRRCLHIRAGPGPCAASWRAAILLPAGSYSFEGRIRVADVTAAAGAADQGAALRVSGGIVTNRLVKTAGWTAQRFEFQVSEPSREVVLVCELRGAGGEAWFDEESLALRRKK